jgi:hypothetical protein
LLTRLKNIFIDCLYTKPVPYNWSDQGLIEPKPIELEVSHFQGSGVFRGIVTFSPSVKFDKKQRRILVDLGSSRVKMKELEHKKPGGLAILTWEMTLMYAGYPEQLIQNIQCEFDSGSSHAGSSADIPENAKRLAKVKCGFKWLESIHSIEFEIDAPVDSQIKEVSISYSVKVPTGYAVLP